MLIRTSDHLRKSIQFVLLIVEFSVGDPYSKHIVPIAKAYKEQTIYKEGVRGEDDHKNWISVSAVWHVHL